MASQVTVRGVPEELSQRLKQLAQERGESLNTTVLRLLEEAVGLHRRRERLARYTTWTADDLAAFEGALREQRTIDEDLWK